VVSNIQSMKTGPFAKLNARETCIYIGNQLIKNFYFTPLRK